MKKWGLLLLLFFSFPAVAEYQATPAKGVAMHGMPRYGWNFKNFDYVNPDAPKGGTLKMSAYGSFDTFNPYTIKGVSAAGTGLLFDTLMVESADEPFSQYGLIAETIEMPKDRSWVAFNINKKAHFSDGTPITAQDVVFSFNLLKTKGLPMFRYYYGNVKEVIADKPMRVLFTFKEGDNRELPLILGQMPILSERYWKDKDFTATTLDRIVGSGPYKIADFETGRYVVYERNPDYWAKDLPPVKGFYNFDKIRYDYYRDATVAVEGFKSAAFDIRIENEAKKWVSAYNGFSEKDGLIKKSFDHSLPSGMQGFVFNTRRPIFADRKVRQALGMVFDFEWSNKNLFYGLYQRTQSYFDNSEMASKGLPKGEELKLLEGYKDQLPPEVFKEKFVLEKTAGDGNIRPQLEKAFALLEQAGWTIQDGVLKNEQGEPFRFEILIDSASSAAWERITLPYIRNLKRLGIAASLRAVDTTQYKNRVDSYDYDMIVHVWGQSTSPGNEQRYFWGSASADMPGSQNYAGIKNPAADELIEKIIEAPDRKKLVAAVKALDRVLLWEHYVVPHWYIPSVRLVYWDKFGMPNVPVMKGVQLMTWWVDPQKETALQILRSEKKEQAEAARKTVLQRLKEWF
ncbi:MAG: ABC transporter substrate-binding protein [Alphaproteobacteria bacterium]|nr:ABC transporter substrate-binding protein [Alphaproteobacteria bacterium]